MAVSKRALARLRVRLTLLGLGSAALLMLSLSRRAIFAPSLARRLEDASDSLGTEMDLPDQRGDISLLSALLGTPQCITGFDTYGGVVVYLLVVLYTFVGLAIVCDDYFCSSLEKISEKLELSEDVAGATFMAAGSSAPELFTSLVTIFIAPGEQGVGTIVGSAVFNLCVIVGLSCFCAGQVLDLFWWPLTRDCATYGISLVMMLAFMADGAITVAEGACMVALYVVYLLVMWKNHVIVEKLGGDPNAPAADAETSMGDQELAAMPEPFPELHAENGNGAAALPVGEREERRMSKEAILPMDGAKEEEASGTPGGGGDDDDEGPQGPAARALEIISKPIAKAMALSIPDCREEKWEKWYALTFLMSIFWIGFLSFLMVDFATRAACVLYVPELLIGLVVLSVGTSVPDALASVIVARQGQGNMAVCNAVGSNIFNICLCLGLPWLVKAAAEGVPYGVPDFAEVGEPLLILILYLALWIGIIKIGGWKLSPNVGIALMVAQGFYTTWTLLRNVPVDAPIIDW